MAEKYSSGYNANVYRISSREKQCFPHADLVRRDKSPDQVHNRNHHLLYYQSKIAKTLFPDNFIEVVGGVRKERSPLYRLIGALSHNPARDHFIYSKEAAVLSDHAVFAKHFIKVCSDINYCSCEVCQKHNNFHQDTNLKQKAEALVQQADDYGLILPHDDASDYCLDDLGNIVFFEVEALDEQKLLTTVTADTKNPDREKILHYLSRYRKANNFPYYRDFL